MSLRRLGTNESPTRESNPALRLRRPPCARHTRGESLMPFFREYPRQESNLVCDLRRVACESVTLRGQDGGRPNCPIAGQPRGALALRPSHGLTLERTQKDGRMFARPPSGLFLSTTLSVWVSLSRLLGALGVLAVQSVLFFGKLAGRFTSSLTDRRISNLRRSDGTTVSEETGGDIGKPTDIGYVCIRPVGSWIWVRSTIEVTRSVLLPRSKRVVDTSRKVFLWSMSS